MCNCYVVLQYMAIQCKDEITKTQVYFGFQRKFPLGFDTELPESLFIIQSSIL